MLWVSQNGEKRIGKDGIKMNECWKSVDVTAMIQITLLLGTNYSI